MSSKPFIEGVKIYTSHFRGKKIGRGISIATRQPSGMVLNEFKRLAPYKWMIADHVTIPDYMKAFEDILATLDPNDVVEKLIEVAHGSKEFTLCCWEKPGEFCHRHMVAEWLKKAGYEVVEVSDLAAVKKPEAPPPPGLFD